MGLKLFVLLCVAVATVSGRKDAPTKDNWQELVDDLRSVKATLKSVSNVIAKRKDAFAARKGNWHPSEVESDEVNQDKLKNVADVADVAYLRMLTNTAKNIVVGMEANDVSKAKAITTLESLADKFVTTVRDMKTKKGYEKAMVELEPLKDELRGIARDVEANMELTNDKKELKGVAYLRALINTGKNVVGGVGTDGVSKKEALAELETLARKFVNTVRDMYAKEGSKKTMVLVESLKEEARSIARAMDGKLGLSEDTAICDQPLKDIGGCGWLCKCDE